VRMTPTLARVLHTFLEDPTKPRWGYDVMRSARIQSGTLYPLMARLEEAGWLQAGWEHDLPESRPPRKYYQLTAEGLTNARLELASYGRQKSARAGRASGRPAAESAP
jgi:PadR family transcriptional regulator, regulatory protein PadR